MARFRWSSSTPSSDDEFVRVLEREHAVLARVAFAIVRNEEDANDALQEAVANTYSRWRRGLVDDLARYLTISVRNSAIAIARKRQRKIRAIDSLATLAAVPADSDESFRSDIDRDVLWGKFAALSVECQTVIRLRKLDRVPVRDVAQQLCISEGTVKSRCSRCLAQLGRMIGDDHE